MVGQEKSGYDTVESLRIENAELQRIGERISSIAIDIINSQGIPLSDVPLMMTPKYRKWWDLVVALGEWKAVKG